MTETFIVVGLGYGDEGKGTIVDYLTREHRAHTIVRFNGGAQAAHNVVTPEGKHHTFAQFGSGTLAGARTHLSRFMLVNPLDFWNEVKHLRSLGITNTLSLISISPQALVTTPLHIVANQIREEQRWPNKHGTCGKGIGETQAAALSLSEAALRVEDLRHEEIVISKLEQLDNHYSTTLFEDFTKEHGSIKKMAQEYKDFADAISMRDDDYVLELQGQGKTVIFEGAQGILLDQDVGFHPHTTWSSTTSQNAREMIPADANPVAIGVTRAYTTRHGEGPIVAGDFHPGPELHNREDGWQGGFRFGSWDAIALDYASKCDLIDEVAVTCLDHIAEDWSSVWSYDYEGDMPDLHPYFWAEGRRIFSITPGDDRAHVEAIATRLKRCTCNINHHRGVGPEYIADAIGEVLHAPVTIQSFGPTHTDKKTRVFA